MVTDRVSVVVIEGNGNRVKDGFTTYVEAIVRKKRAAALRQSRLQRRAAYREIVVTPSFDLIRMLDMMLRSDPEDIGAYYFKFMVRRFVIRELRERARRGGR